MQPSRAGVRTVAQVRHEREGETGGEQHQHRADHRDRSSSTELAWLVALGLVGLGREQRVILRSQPEEHPPRRAQQPASDQRRGDDHHHGEPTEPELVGRALDHRGARKAGERRQAREDERAQRERDAHERQRSALAAQLQLVTRAEPVHEHADAEKERSLDEPVADDRHGRAAKPARSEQGDAREEETAAADRREREQPLQMPLHERHQATHQHCQARDPEQHAPDGRGARPERAREHRPVHAGERIQAEVAHDGREDRADRCRRDRVRIREPEVKRHRRRFHEESRGEKGEREHQQPVRRLRGEGTAHLCEVERAGPAVEQSDPDQDEEAGDAVRDREDQTALQWSELGVSVGGERVRDDAHQLEEDEEVEEVAGQAEPDHRAEEDEHERVIERGDLVEVVPREDEHAGHDDGGEAREPRADGIDNECDTHGHAAARMPAPEPVDHASAPGMDDERSRQDRRGRGDCGRAGVERPRRQEPPDRRDRRRGEQRHGDRQRNERRHQPRIAASASGSSSPLRLKTSIASASRSAETVTLTTTSVRTSACTTGSTAGLPTGTSLKTGAVAPLRKPIASSKT